MDLKFYEYSKCSTCQKALKYLTSQKINFEKIAIVDHPPTLSELKKMLQFLKNDGKNFKNLFNTSGVLYRELKISEQLKNGLTESDALKLLSQNGKLIKRPFLIGPDFGTVGFNESAWKTLLRAPNSK